LSAIVAAKKFCQYFGVDIDHIGIDTILVSNYQLQVNLKRNKSSLVLNSMMFDSKYAIAL
jgi:hypothetical protein